MRSIDYLTSLAADGLDFVPWYDEAFTSISAVAACENWNLKRFIDLLAIFSPRCSVLRSIRFAFQYQATGQLFHNAMRNIRVSLATYNRTGSILGPKTGPFAQALLGDHSAIVLDVWIARALDVPQAKFKVIPLRNECKRRIRLAAKRLGQSARDTQACIWASIIRQYGRRPSSFPVWQEYANFLAYGREYPLSGYISQLA